MKLTSILLLAACLQVSARVHSQTVNFSGKNVPLEKVFASVEKQTGYVFFFDDAVILGAKPVTIRADNMLLELFLNTVLKEQPLKFSFQNKTIVISRKQPTLTPVLQSGETSHLPHPPIDIHGRVTDENGKPLTGVTVTVKSTKNATATDANGEFNLTGIDENATLVFTSVNMQVSEVKVAGRTELTIVLKAKVTELNIVTVTTAYGVEKEKKELGYSATTISGEEISQTRPINLLNGLVGKVPGLQLNTTTSGVKPSLRVLLRGVRSLTGDNTPLFVLDGTPLIVGSNAPVNASIAVLNIIYDLNPVDIESVTVLRGANATTLYGAEGVNGVIMINTKRGSDKPQLNFNHSTSIQTVDTRYPKLQTRFGPGYLRNVFGDGVYDPYGGSGGFNWGPEFNGQEVEIGRPDENGNVQKVPYSYTKERLKFFNTAFTVQNGLSFSAGDARSHYYIGLEHTDIAGIIPGDKSKINTLRFNGDRTYGIFKNALHLNISRSDDDLSTSSSVFSTIFYTPAHIPLTKYKDFQNNEWADHNHYYNDNLENPYEVIANSRNNNTGYSLLGNFTLTAVPLKWLTITNRTGLNFSSSTAKFTRKGVFYSDFAKTNGRPISVSDRAPILSEGFNLASNISNDLLLRITKKWKNYSFDLLAGNTIKESFSKSMSVYYSNLGISNLFNLSNGTGTPFISEQDYKTRTVSFLGSLTLGYKDWIFLEFSGRNNKESVVQSGQTAQTYYGVNLSTVLTDALPILAKNKVVSYARLRAALNKSANFNYFVYTGQQLLFRSPGYPFSNLLSYELSTQNTNRFTDPERILSQEYGGEFRFWKDRLSLDISYYSQINDGLVLTIPVSTATGFGTLRGVNAGKFNNKGWEFQGQLNPLIKLPNGFQVAMSGNLAINKNTVVELTKGQQELSLGENIAIVGRTFPILRITDWNRDSSGRVIVDPVTGLPSPNPVPITKGRILPEYIAGLTLQLSWKKLVLRCVAEYRGGYYTNNPIAFNLNYYGLSAQSAINGRQRFVFPNSVYWDGSKYIPNTNIVVSKAGLDFPALYTKESNYYSSAAFWKIRELVLSYDLPVKTRWLKKATIALMGRNLWTFLPKTNTWGDPEISLNNYTTRYFGFNLNASF